MKSCVDEIYVAKRLGREGVEQIFRNRGSLHLSEEDFSDGPSSHGPREVGVYDGRHCLVKSVQQAGTTLHQHQHHRLAYSTHREGGGERRGGSVRKAKGSKNVDQYGRLVYPITPEPIVYTILASNLALNLGPVFNQPLYLWLVGRWRVVPVPMAKLGRRCLRASPCSSPPPDTAR